MYWNCIEAVVDRDRSSFLLKYMCCPKSCHFDLSLSLSLLLSLCVSVSLSPLSLSLFLSLSLSFIPTYTSTADRCYTEEFKFHSSPEREFHVHRPSRDHSQPHPSAQWWKWLPERQPHAKDAQPPWLPQCCRLPCTRGKYTIIVRLHVAECHPKKVCKGFGGGGD